MTGQGRQAAPAEPALQPGAGQAADEEIARFYSEHRDRVRRFLVFGCGCPSADAEDIIQDTIMAIRRRYWPTVRTLDKPEAYWFKSGRAEIPQAPRPASRPHRRRRPVRAAARRGPSRRPVRGGRPPRGPEARGPRAAAAAAAGAVAARDSRLQRSRHRRDPRHQRRLSQDAPAPREETDARTTAQRRRDLGGGSP